MNESDGEKTLAIMRQQIEDLRSEVRDSQRQIARLLELLEEQKRQTVTQQGSIIRLERTFMDLTTGRLWRTLRAVGGVLKKFSPGQGQRNVYLECDDPPPNDERPRSGKIKVRGWALAKNGIDTVQLLVPGLGPLEVKPSIPRPDVQKAFPNVQHASHCGFLFEFDSLAIPNGRQAMVLRAIAGGNVVRESTVFVVINHEEGFSSDYQRWISRFEKSESDIITLKLRTYENQPLISIIMPVFNTKMAELTAAVESVLRQSYGRWELCIADDSSPKQEVRETLAAFAAQDKRIRVSYLSERGGISRASNAAWQMAKGEYICFLDHDDELAPHALAWVCDAISQNPAADLIYSDEDKIDEAGERYDPFFKPEWSPDLLLSENYVCHLLVLRRDLANKAGFLQPEMDGSQDYDLVLRASALATGIHHIARVLYHWRAGATSTAAGIENKSYAIEAAQKALQMHCRRAGNGAEVEPSTTAGRWRIRYPVGNDSRVSIIIASGGRVDALRTNLESLFEKTSYTNFEVVVIDNSKNNNIENLVNGFRANRKNLRYVNWRGKAFNYSEINNVAARTCESPVLLFLNDDTSVIERGWLEAMTELALRPEVGAVGAKLLYPNGAIQHAGVVLGIFDNCGHAFKGMDGARGYYFDFTDVIRNVSAVTGACLMTRTEVFWEVGGFDETQFAVAFNDIDLCLKIGAKGYRVLYTPHALLYHHESLSKTSKDLIPHPDEVEAMRAKWGSVISKDPYYSPNLTRSDESYSPRAV